MTASLSEKDLELLKEAQIAAVATINEDGSIQLTPVWVESDGEAVLFNTAVGRVKHRNLSANPNVGLLVVDKEDPHRWVSVRGKAEITEEGADAHIDRLSNKYLGTDYPFRGEGEVRVSVRVLPEHKNLQLKNEEDDSPPTTRPKTVEEP